MNPIILSFKIPFNKHQKNSLTFNLPRKKKPQINSIKSYLNQSCNPINKLKDLSQSLNKQNLTKDSLIIPYKEKKTSSTNFLITEQQSPKESSSNKLLSNIIKRNRKILINHKNKKLSNSIVNIHNKNLLSQNISPSPRFNKSLDVISPSDSGSHKHKNENVSAKKILLNNQPLPSLMCRKEIKNIPIIANYPDLFNNLYSTSSEKERYYRLLEAFLKLKSMIEIDSRNTFKYFKEFLYKNGITNKEYYTNEYLLNLSDFIKSDFSSQINPNKNITQNLYDILTKGRNHNHLKRNNSSSYISPLINRNKNKNIHHKKEMNTRHISMDGEFYIFPLPQQSQINHEKVASCKDNEEMKHILSSELQLDHKVNIDLDEGVKLYNLINSCSKDKTKFLEFTRNYIYSNKLSKYKLLDKDKQILNLAKKHHKMTEYALLSSLNKEKTNLFNN